MKHTLKRLTACLMIIAFILCTVASCSDGAESGSTAQSIAPADPQNFVFTEEEYEGTRYYSVSGVTEQGKKLTELEVPETYEGLPVTALNTGCFSGCDKLETLTLHSSVREFYADLFPGCTSLKTIKLDFAALADEIWADSSIAEDLVCATATDGSVTGTNSFLQDLDENGIILLFTDSVAYNYFRSDYNWASYADVMKLDETAATTTSATVTEAQAEGTSDGQTHGDPDVYRAITPEKNQTCIIYDCNGGSTGTAFGTSGIVTDKTGKIVVKKGNGYFVQLVTDSYYLCPHTVGDKGYLTRPGYVLNGYNTRADGSGTHYGCGWNVPIVKGERIVLYAEWAEETPLSDFTVEGTKIVSYKGSAATVVIPNGFTEISAGAFTGLENLETVIMPKSMTVLNSKAFLNCKKLKYVYQFDLITTMPSNSFYGCDAFDTLYINNANNIIYIGNMKQGSYQMKFQRLLLKQDKKKIIFIGGSNLLYGLDGERMEQNFGGEYEIIDYGIMYQSPASFFIDLCSNFLCEGDIIVTCPEEEAWQWGQIAGTATGSNFKNASVILNGLEGYMEAISYVDIRIYKGLLPAIASANSERKTASSNKITSYEAVYSETVNEYGNFDYERTVQKDSSKWSVKSKTNWFGATNRKLLFTESNAANLNRAFDACKAKGAMIFISFAVTDRNLVADDSTATLSAYEESVRELFVYNHSGTYLISSVSTYLFDHADFYNQHHHLLSAAQLRRTDLLYEDMKKQLDLLGLGQD